MTKTIRGEKVRKECKNCKKVFFPRKADVARGWGRFCSKSCKASEQNKRKPYDFDKWRKSCAKEELDIHYYEPDFDEGWDSHK